MQNPDANRNSSVKTNAITSMLALSRLVDRNISSVSRWMNRPDWPFNRKAPWKSEELPKILQWVTDHLDARSKGRLSVAPIDEPEETDIASPDASGGETVALRKDKLRKEIQKFQEQIKGLQTDNLERDGKLLRADDVEAEWVSIANLMRNAFQNLASQIVPLALSDGLPHEAASGFQNKVEAAVAGILRHLSKNGNEDE